MRSCSPLRMQQPRSHTAQRARKAQIRHAGGEGGGARHTAPHSSSRDHTGLRKPARTSHRAARSSSDADAKIAGCPCEKRGLLTKDRCQDPERVRVHERENGGGRSARTCVCAALVHADMPRRARARVHARRWAISHAHTHTSSHAHTHTPDASSVEPVSMSSTDMASPPASRSSSSCA